MNALLKPSLTRRTIVALLVGFVLIGLVLTGVILVEALAPVTGGVDRKMRESVLSIEQVFQAADGDEQLLQRVGVVRELIRPIGDDEVLIDVAVRRGPGPWMPVTERFPQHIPWPAAAGFGDLESSGTDYRFYIGSGSPWQVIAIRPVRATNMLVLESVARDLALYLTIALPCALFPLWLSVRTGLKPLYRLALALESRTADDLSAVQLPKPYADLEPLVGALNQVLTRLRGVLARERAFIQDAAHEMRTPLAVAQAQMHLMQNATSAETHTEARVRLARALDRLGGQTQQMLVLARLESRGPLVLEPQNLMDVLRDALSDVSERAAQCDITLSLQGPQDLIWPTDALALRCIVDNLLDNALKYVPSGGRTQIEVAQHADRVVLSVMDDGPGIAWERREAVFQRFHRATASGQPGAGLGLSIVRQAAASIGARVELIDCPWGQGCNFQVELLCAQAHRPARSSH